MSKVNRITSNIGSPEMIGNFSWSQLRLAPAARHTLHAWALTSITITVWLVILINVMSGFQKTRWAFGSVYPLAIVICLAGLSLLNSVRLWYRHRTAPVFGKLTCLVFALLLLWCAVTVVRFDWLNRSELKQAFGGRYFSWAWVIPICMVLGADILIWRRVLGVIVSAGAIGCTVVFFGWMLGSLHTDFELTSACPLALLFWNHLPERKRRIVLLGAVISLVLSVLSASRSFVVAAALPILFASYIQFFRLHTRYVTTRISIMLAYSIVIILVSYVASVDRVPFVGNTMNTGIARFKDKVYKNTRGGLKGDSLYTTFFREVDGLDLIIGRGSQGRYRMELRSPEGPFGGYSASHYRRRYVECGYLQVILHGGLLMLALILSLAISAIYLGMFRTRNWFTRGCAFIILSRLLEMVPFGLPATDVTYVLFWMAIGACLTLRIRVMSDADIVGIFAARSALGVGEER